MEGTTMDVDPNDSNETANIKNNVGIENKIESPHMKKDIANNDHTNTKAPISSIEKGYNGIISASNNSNNVKETDTNKDTISKDSGESKDIKEGNSAKTTEMEKTTIIRRLHT